MKKLKELGHEPTPQEMRQINQVCENTAEQNARVVVDAQKASFMWNQMVYYCNTESSLDVNSLVYIFKTGAFDGMLDAAKIVSALDPAIEMPNIKEEVYQMESSPQKFAEAFKAVAEYMSLVPNIFKEEG